MSRVLAQDQVRSILSQLPVRAPWRDRRQLGRSRPTLRAWTLGQLDDWITKPVEAADEHFHAGVTPGTRSRRRNVCP
jgi:hypothetical protein